MVEHAVEYMSKQTLNDVDEEDDIEKAKEYAAEKYNVGKKTTETTARSGRGGRHEADSMEEDSSDEPAPTTTTTRGRGRGRARARGRAASTSTRGRAASARSTHDHDDEELVSSLIIS